MTLPATKQKFLILALLLIILLTASAAAFFVLSSNKDSTEPQKVEETPDASSQTPEIPVKVLAAERLTQYLDKTNEYDLADIQGTPDKSMFPDVQDPKFLAVAKENKLKSSDVVASFHIGEDYRAYPLKYILFHHLVNDKFGNKPVLISYCGICNSAAAYDPVVGGKTLSFGVLGVLLHNDLVMYDRQTDSWWIQVTGEGIKGKHKGKRLTLLPGMELIDFGDFKKSYPKGKVLQPVSQYSNFYEQFNPEQFYEEDESGSDSTDRDQVVGIEVRGKAKAYKIEDVKKKKVINDNLNGWSLLIVADPRDGGVRIFRRFLDAANDSSTQSAMILKFELVDGKLKDKETGSTWNFQGEAVEGELKGKTLNQPEYLELFQFAWKGFYPKTAVYKP